MSLAPEHILRLKPYVPGKPAEELERELGLQETIKLASNENPLGPSPLAVKAVRETLGKIHRYPDGGGYYLCRALARKSGLSPDQILLGNGSNELLDLVVRTFYRPGMNAVTSENTFVVYPMAMQAVDGECRTVPMRNQTYDLDAMSERVDDQTLCVFIANPNNPTGTVIHRDHLERFLSRIPDTVLVVLDEAYFEYVEDKQSPDGLSSLKEGGNVLVLRTFSKIHGLAGLRIGYAMGDREIIDAMNRVREPFNTNVLAQAAALAALEDTEHLEASVRLNREGKTFLYSGFERIGLSYTPTEANFVWVKTPGEACKIYERLLHEGVIVRPMADSHLRITIGLPAENQRLIKALESLLK